MLAKRRSTGAEPIAPRSKAPCDRRPPRARARLGRMPPASRSAFGSVASEEAKEAAPRPPIGFSDFTPEKAHRQGDG